MKANTTPSGRTSGHLPVRLGPFRLSLRTRMALGFSVLFAVVLLLVSLIRTFGLPWTSNRGSFGDAQAMVLRQLSLLADVKKERLLLWFEERKSDAAVLAQSEALTSFFRKLHDEARNDSRSGRSRSELRTELLNGKSGQDLTGALHLVTRSHTAYRKIQIADAEDGVVIASTDDRDVGEQVSDRHFFPTALRAGETSTVLVAKSPATGKPHVVVSHTISSKFSESGDGSASVLGLVIMHADEDHLFQPLLHIGGGVGESEDVVLVDQDRKIITPLKYPLPKGANANTLEYRITAEPAVLASKGKEGIVVSRDYRGVPVLAAYRHIKISPDSGWGLVVKVDQDEIFGPTRARVVYASFVSFLGVIAVAVLATVIAGRIARPIQNLSLTAREVESGNLNARATVVGTDEVGNLAATFNSMIERVQNWHQELEEQVKNRTLRLTELNQKLTREVVERKRAETRIQQQHDFMETVLESLAHPFYVIDASDYTIKMANSAASFGEISDSSTCYALTHGRSQPCAGDNHLCPLEEVRQTGRPAVAEHVHYDKHGNARHVEVHAHPIFDASGTVVQVIEYSLDITDRKRADKERELLIRELEAKNAELERFTYTVSHDLKSPLITIKGFLGYLERDVASSNLTRLRTDSARIHGAVERMGQLLDELLELSRIGRIMNPPHEVSLDNLVREVRESLAGRIAERGVTVDIADGLPVLYGDVARLREVVENLLDNAIKFMGDQPHPRIEIGVRRCDGETVVCVKDNGIGIDPRYHVKIFGLFERLEQKTEGTGIGLAIVSRIVKVHGGRIWVESEGVGHGSAFCFSLPERNEEKTGRR